MRVKGFGLIEVLVVIVIIGFLSLLLSSIPNSLTLIGKSKYLNIAREIADKQVEEKRVIPYANLANGTTNVIDDRLSGLPGSSGTITIDDCTPQVCTNNELMKQLTVTINWNELGKAQTLKISTLISEDGLGK